MPKHKHSSSHSSSSSSSNQHKHRHHHGGSSGSGGNSDRDRGRKRDNEGRDRNNRDRDRSYNDRNSSSNSSRGGGGGRDRNERNNDNRGGGSGNNSYRDDYSFPRGGNDQMNSSSGPSRWNNPSGQQSNRNPWEQPPPQPWSQHHGNNNSNQHRRFDQPSYQQQQPPRRRDEPSRGYHNSDNSHNDRGGGGGDGRNQSRDRQGGDNRGPWGGHNNSSYSQHSRDGHYSRNEQWDQSNKRRRYDDAQQEEQRLIISQKEPNKIFMEEVNLAPEFAFRIDTRGNERQLKYPTLNLTNTSRFQPSYRRDDVFGATEEEWLSMPFRSVFSRCVQPLGMDEEGNLVNDDGIIVDEEGNPIDAPVNTSDNNKNGDKSSSSSGNNNKSSTSSSSSKKKEHSKSTSSVAPFISFDPPKSHNSNDKSIIIMGGRDRDVSTGRNNHKSDPGGGGSGVKIHKTGATFRDRIETYNVELRKDPRNIVMWRKFVKFQDQVFEHEAEEAFSGSSVVSTDATGKKTKNKRNRKALAEKKISILDKAIESNPKSLELHLDRLDIVYEIFKPRYVLGEWKKLVAMYSQIGAFWMEYLRFASTDLQLYTTQAVIGIFEKSFQKFHLMLNPNYPNFQRPEKFLLLMADLTFSLSLILRNAGWLEKAISLHQAQLEIDFHFPPLDSIAPVDSSVVKPTTPKASLEWEELVKVQKQAFEQFWDAGTRRFGEPGATGWASFVQHKNENEAAKEAIGVKESEVSEFEDKFFETLTGEEEEEDEEKEEEEEEETEKRSDADAEGEQKKESVSTKESIKKLSIAHHWVTIESFRSMMHYLPWRVNCSDADECEDSQRIVQANELIPFLTPLLPNAQHITNFDRGSVQFRHVVNYLLLLREDFLPRTHTLDCILSPFLSSSLTSASTFFSEIYYWKTTLDLYMLKGSEDKISIPEGFDLHEFATPSPYENIQFSCDEGNSNKITEEILVGYPESVENLKKDTIKKNLDNYLAMVRTVVESSVESLQPRFASLLAQMYLRFLQRLSYFQGLENHKVRMKSAKSLLERHEKLRSSTALYGEMAMLEFYGGARASASKTKASDILVKTINSTSLILQRDEKEPSGIKELRAGESWETVAEITRFYRLLAELHLRENEKVSLKILTALGNKFQQVNLTSSDDDESMGDIKKTNEVLIARRQFERVLAILMPDNDEEDGINSILSKWDGDKSLEYLLQNTNFLVEWSLSFALFLYLSTDYAAASDFFTKTMKRFSSVAPLSRSTTYQSHIVNSSNIREQLYLGWCKIGMMEVCKDPMQNSKFRQTLHDALTEFPSSPPLLLLFTDVEKQSSVAGKIWRLMMGAVKNESSSSSLHWAPLFMSLGLARKVEQLRSDEEVGLPEFGLGGPAVPCDTIYYKLDAVLSTAEKNSSSRNCPLIWRIHLKSTALRGRKPNGEKDNQAARGIFLEAIRHCPSVKTLYMDALSYFPDMYKEIHGLMSEKQILVRLPLEELNVLLECENDEGANQEGKKGQNVSNIDSDDEDVEEDEDEMEHNESKEVVDISSTDDCGIEAEDVEEKQSKVESEEVSEGEITDDG